MCQYPKEKLFGLNWKHLICARGYEICCICSDSPSLQASRLQFQSHPLFTGERRVGQQSCVKSLRGRITQQPPTVSLLPADRGRVTLQSHRLLRWASQDDKHLRQAEKVPKGLFIHRRTITEPKGEKLPVNALPSHRGADGKYSVLLEHGAETVRSRGCVSRNGESLCKHNCSSVLLNFCHCVLPD